MYKTNIKNKQRDELLRLMTELDFKGDTESFITGYMAAKDSIPVEAPVSVPCHMTDTQQKNLAWFLPRPKPDRYKGGMPLYAEDWLIKLAEDLLSPNKDIHLLNLFCGMNKRGYRVDIKEEVSPDLICDAHKLSQHLEPVGPRFNIILADPPYSDEEAKTIYGTPRLNYKKWTAEADKYLKVGGLLIVYHKYVMPNPNPDKYEVVKRVFIGNRTYHLPRVAIYFRKKAH